MLTLSLLPDTLAICRLETNAPIPPWAMAGPFFSITKSGDELSIVCPDRNVPHRILYNGGWRCLKVEGPMDLSVVGVVQSLAQPLAGANISVFILSTFDTDYVMVKETDMESAIRVLEDAGCCIQH